MYLFSVSYNYNISFLRDFICLFIVIFPKSLLVRVKEAHQESEKVGLKLNIQKLRIMTSGPNTLWQIDEDKVESVQILFSWAPKSL